MNPFNAWKGKLEVACFLPSKSLERQCDKRRQQQSRAYEAAFARTVGQESDFCVIGSFFLFTHYIEIQRLNQYSTTIK